MARPVLNGPQEHHEKSGRDLHRDTRRWNVRWRERLREGTTTVVWHSVVRQYLDAGEQQHLDDRVERLGSQASPTAPLANLTMEPAGDRGAGTPGAFPVVLRTWSGRPGDGAPRVLGHAVPHGLPTTWA